MLTYYGRKVQPIKICLSILDMRSHKHQHENLGTLLATMDAGTVIFTLFPNLTMSLSDPYSTEALKILVQILETPNAANLYPIIHY